MRIFLSYVFSFFLTTAHPQVGIGTQNPNASAQLDVTSSNKGLLPPRMTSVQRDAIENPSPGLMIFNTSTQSLEIFSDYGWAGIQIQIPARKLLGGRGDEEAYCIKQTADGGYIVAGTSTSSAEGDVSDMNHSPVVWGTHDYWIVKLDAHRNITWNKLLGGDEGEFARSIQQTSDGGYIVAGYSASSANGDVTEDNNGQNDFWIVKLDASGNIQWNKLIGGTGDDKAQSIDLTADGGYIVAGYSNNSEEGGNVSQVTQGGYDYWIVKLNAEGNIEWDKLIGGSGEDQAFSIIQAADDAFVVAGRSTSSNSGNVTDLNHGGTFPYDSWIVRLSPNGSSILWNKLLGGTGNDEAQSIQQTTGDGYIIAAYSTSSGNGDVTGINHGMFQSPDYWIIKLDRTGHITWNKLIGGDNFDFAFSIKQTSDGGYIVAGSSNSSAHGDVTSVNHTTTQTEDYWIVKLDGFGNIVWNQLLGGSAADHARSILQTSDGGFIVAGFSRSSFNGDVTSGNHRSATNDLWIIKLGSNGYLY